MAHQYGHMQPGPGGYMQQKPPSGAIPMMSSEEQTMMWAQRSYYVDSGIHSGVTTHGASSLISGASSNLVDEYSDPYTPGYTQEQVDSKKNVTFLCTDLKARVPYGKRHFSSQRRGV